MLIPLVKPSDFNNVEMASMTGSIAWQKEIPSLHAHGVVTDTSFKAAGGHLLSATVSTGYLEITVIVHDKNWNVKWKSPWAQMSGSCNKVQAIQRGLESRDCPGQRSS